LTRFRLSYNLDAPVTSLNGQSEDRFTVEAPVEPVRPVQPPRQDPSNQRPNQQQNQNVNQFQDDKAVCGVPVAGFTQSLVIGGKAAGHGEW
jgi:hypothetical protein